MGSEGPFPLLFPNLKCPSYLEGCTSLVKVSHNFLCHTSHVMPDCIFPKEGEDERNKSVVSLTTLMALLLKQVNRDSENPKVTGFCAMVRNLHNSKITECFQIFAKFIKK